MSTAYMNTAKGMAEYLLTREHRGPGDTIEVMAEIKSGSVVPYAEEIVSLVEGKRR